MLKFYIKQLSNSLSDIATYNGP